MGAPKLFPKLQPTGNGTGHVLDSRSPLNSFGPLKRGSRMGWASPADPPTPQHHLILGAWGPAKVASTLLAPQQVC